MLRRLLVGTATVALLATMAVSHARAEEVFEPSESPYPTEPGVTWHVGRQSDGWAPVMLEGECGPGTKQVELEFTPARSVTLLGHEGTGTAGGRLSLTIALEVTAPWSVSMSATGRITVEVSCLVEDNVVELSGSAEIDTTTADAGAPGVSATPSDAVFHPGGEIEIAVEGFQPNDELTIDMYSSLVRPGTARTDARGRLYEMLIEKGEKRILYKLSTNMCAQHRSDVIENIKKQMNSGEHVVCISTQLIEAGVDLDFTCVVRSYAGIDSIVQASGRCNREGKQEIGRVVLVNLGIEENIKSLKEIKNKKDVTEYILHQQVSPIDIATLNDHFFERYYAVSQNLMDYPVGDNETVYDYLSQNNYMGAMTAGILKHSFKTAGQKMNLIQEETIGVLVLYGEGKEELNKLEEMLSENTYYDLEKLKEIKNLLKKLQPYSINVREGDELLKAAKSYLNGQILILPKEYYDEQTGVNRSIHSFLL